MILALVCSAILVITPILVVQYQRFLEASPSKTIIPSVAPIHQPTQQYTSSSQKSIQVQNQSPKACRLVQAARQSSTSHPSGEARYDGAASDSASEGTSKQHTSGVATMSYESGERKESRKPWDPPFPMRKKTVVEPYRVLPSIGNTWDQDYGEMNTEKKEEEKRKSTSQVPPDDGEDMGLDLGRMAATNSSSYSAPAPAPQFSLSGTPAQQLQHDIQTNTKDNSQQNPPGSQSTPTGVQLRRSPSIVQVIVLIFAFVIFVFVFAILVAHCMAWFVVYKAEVRLGDLRKGLLRGGDMRVCLCAR